MSKTDFDIIVVGAGPAGSTAARYAASQGARVLMLERDREPGIPVRCAEGCVHKDIAEVVDINPRWIATTIDTAKFVGPDGSFFTFPAAGTGYVLNRKFFDADLAELACKAGVVLLTRADATGVKRTSTGWQVDVNLLGRSTTYSCKLLIGADGVESAVGRWAGIDTTVKPEDIDCCMQYTLTGAKFEDNVTSFYLGADIAPGGYVWVFPKSASSANVGIAVSGKFNAIRNAKQYLDDFVDKHYPNASCLYSVAGGAPTAIPKNMHADNLMLVGDAARQVDPLTGGGLAYSLFAGKICGQVAARAVQNNNYGAKFLADYKKQWDARHKTRFKLFYAIKQKYFSKLDDKNLNKKFAVATKIPPQQMDKITFFKTAVMNDPLLLLELGKVYLGARLGV